MLSHRFQIREKKDLLPERMHIYVNIIIFLKKKKVKTMYTDSGSYSPSSGQKEDA